MHDTEDRDFWYEHGERQEHEFLQLAARHGLPVRLNPAKTRDKTAIDLLLTLPHAGVTRRSVARLADLRPPEIATLTVRVERHAPPSAKGRPWRVICTDATGGAGDLTLVFFHARAAWVEAQLPAGAVRVVSGKVELFDGLAQMVHPDHILSPSDPPPSGFEPVYPLAGALTQRVVDLVGQLELEIGGQQQTIVGALELHGSDLGGQRIGPLLVGRRCGLETHRPREACR